MSYSVMMRMATKAMMIVNVRAIGLLQVETDEDDSSAAGDEDEDEDRHVMLHD